MCTGVTVYLIPTDRKRLQAIVDDRNSPQKHVWRARIVLATADGLGTATIMRTAGVSKTAVGRWQERFMSEGVDGLLRDKTRPARIAKLTERIVALTLGEPPGRQALPNDVKERIERGKRSIGRVTHRSTPVFGTPTLTARAVNSCQHPPRCILAEALAACLGRQSTSRDIRNVCQLA
jgi:transposase